MKIAVFSDSHGDTDNMCRAIENYKPELIVHLGDCVRDAEYIRGFYPRIPMYNVCGNCDYAPQTEEHIITEEGGVRIFMAHGHRHGVKMGLDSFVNSVGFSGSRLGLFGHTHTACVLEYAGLTIVNPGSCGKGKRPSWAKIEIVNGEIFCSIEYFGGINEN